MGDFLLLENFSSSSQSSRSARAVSFSHQSLQGSWARRCCGPEGGPRTYPRPEPHLPLVRNAEVTCQLFCALAVAAEDEGGDRVVQRQVHEVAPQLIFQAPLQPQEPHLILRGLGQR